MSQQRCDLWRLQQSASRKCKGSIYTVYRYTETYIFFTQAGVMAGVGEGENAPASSLSLTFLGMCTLLCIIVYLFWHPAAIVEYHLSIKMSLFNKYSPLWSSYGKRAKQHAGTRTCREYSLQSVDGVVMYTCKPWWGFFAPHRRSEQTPFSMSDP